MSALYYIEEEENMYIWMWIYLLEIYTWKTKMHQTLETYMLMMILLEYEVTIFYIIYARKNSIESTRETNAVTTYETCPTTYICLPQRTYIIS